LRILLGVPLEQMYRNPPDCLVVSLDLRRPRVCLCRPAGTLGASVSFPGGSPFPRLGALTPERRDGLVPVADEMRVLATSGAPALHTAADEGAPEGGAAAGRRSTSAAAGVQGPGSQLQMLPGRDHLGRGEGCRLVAMGGKPLLPRVRAAGTWNTARAPDERASRGLEPGAGGHHP
jgi:hypothetical protein